MSDYSESDSHYGFGQEIKFLGDQVLGAMAAQFKQLAHIGTEVMPSAQSMKEGYLAAAAEAAALQEEVADIYREWQRQHPRTVERVREPYEGNIGKEVIKDSGLGRRDH